MIKLSAIPKGEAFIRSGISLPTYGKFEKPGVAVQCANVDGVFYFFGEVEYSHDQESINFFRDGLDFSFYARETKEAIRMHRKKFVISLRSVIRTSGLFRKRIFLMSSQRCVSGS